ncbi:protein-disulfide reductase DsbD domain-containing protein [Aureimonas sp. AU4]|uniref:protein-disulfide reductase DsbD domain-containing protein n=1 Tax=Aureimonas sp. AU4 TaxID=1638163 RepID=UPI000784B3D8|nr:protein-disulfide reductase DsbD domain-containing protein [Aureimonas sp. AU4]
MQIDGATLRLSLLEPRSDGVIEGVLSIDLEPGWKTYWKNPGPVGLAPVLNFGRSVSLGPVRTLFPAPIRFDEAGSSSIGYDQPVLLPFSANVAGGGRPRVVLDVTLGLCRALCVPVSATLQAEATKSLSARAVALAAASALPLPGAPGDLQASYDGSDILVRIGTPDLPGKPDVFLDGGAAWSFGDPTKPAKHEANGWSLRLPASVKETRSGDLPSVDIVLTSGEIARSYAGIRVEPVPPAGARPADRTPQP